MSIVIVLVLIAIAVWMPLWGIRAQYTRWKRGKAREQFEDALKHLLDLSSRGQAGSAEAIAGALGISNKETVALISRMEARGVVHSASGGVVLTPEGERSALQIVRAHRLLERYLADEARLPLARVHGAAERAEHGLSLLELDALEAHLGHPEHDPHGDPIPRADGSMPEHEATPLTDWPTGTKGFIVHIEDEPEIIFRQIVALGFRPGKAVRILESGPEYMVLSDGQQEHRIAPIVAANIHVREAALVPSRPKGALRLSELGEGVDARVIAIDPAFRGFARRRLLDLGLTPSAKIRVELGNSFGDPRAYRVRETLIALRQDQARQVWVRLDGADHPTDVTATGAATI